LILDFFVEKRDELKCELQSLVGNGVKFSITADEWTDISKRRYLNVTLQNKRDSDFKSISKQIQIVQIDLVKVTIFDTTIG
jgi:hypothetical protein